MSWDFNEVSSIALMNNDRFESTYINYIDKITEPSLVKSTVDANEKDDNNLTERIATSNLAHLQQLMSIKPDVEDTKKARRLPMDEILNKQLDLSDIEEYPEI